MICFFRFIRFYQWRVSCHSNYGSIVLSVWVPEMRENLFKIVINWNSLPESIWKLSSNIHKIKIDSFAEHSHRHMFRKVYEKFNQTIAFEWQKKINRQKELQTGCSDWERIEHVLNRPFVPEKFKALKGMGKTCSRLMGSQDSNLKQSDLTINHAGRFIQLLFAISEIFSVGLSLPIKQLKMN